jgi:DNA invertase Pin-like site-specific DNA recombinase
MPQTALIYARFSTISQGEQHGGSSLARQLGQGRKFVEEKGWHLEREIADLGRSAFHGANRSESSELYQFEVEARDGLHRGKCLCVENLDRLSRQGIKAAAKLIWALNDSGVDVATWHDGHIYKANSDSDLLDILYIATKAQRAFEESDTKSKRGRDTWQERYKSIAEKKPGTR